MNLAIALLTGTGVLIGKTVHAAISMLVWTTSNISRLILRPFSGLS